ncbi:MAG: ABC transporter ATP-binding protein [Oscillospiraceae bacterium]
MSEKKKKQTSLIKKFISYYKPHKKLFAADMTCAFFVAAFDLIYPIITRDVLNIQIPAKNLNMIFILCSILICFYIIKAFLNYFIQYYGHVVGVRMQSDMRTKIFNKLQKLPFSYFDENKTGQIMSKIITDTMDISELAHHGPEDLFLSILTLIGAFIVLCTINIPITLILFAFIPIIIIFSAKKRGKMMESFTWSRKEVGEINANLENSISGIRVSKSFPNNESEKIKLETSNKNFVRARSKAYKAMAEFFSGNNFIIDIMNVLLLVCGGVFIANGNINISDFLIYVLYINLLLNPIKKLINFTEMFSNAMSGFKRYDELLNQEEEEECNNPKVFENIKGNIVFDNVSFTYDDTKMVVENINFEIKAGEKVALVGPSGGGKTTLCHLLPRFYEISSGKILIDGVDIRQVKRYDLRNAIGVVAQDVFLFAGTIKENIAYGKPNATELEIINAAKSANIDEFINALPEGYETYIGERGIKLSGGQKQRLSIARVFLKNPPIIVLDEATSALDNFTELAIENALNTLCAGRTTIIVAHRLSTIKNANNIIVIDSDGIKEQGNHEQLLKNNKLYSQLYNIQFKQI